MRKIRLSDTDSALFDEEMVPEDYDYLARHKATFCRMWTDQGPKFWQRYVEVFRSYILRYSVVGEMRCESVAIQSMLEFGFVIINTQFVEGKANRAKSFLAQIADLGKNRYRYVHLNSKSVIKDPFYTRETRDIFRELFGPANEKTSYVKVYLLTPLYMRFGGSIVHCLSKWIEAPEMDPDDDSYYMPPAPLEACAPLSGKHAQAVSSPFSELANSLCAYHLDDCNNKFYEQLVKGSNTGPVHLSFWENKDPRFCEPGNPLWNPSATETDWRRGLSEVKFREFYAWCSFNEAIVSLENQCQDCRARKKARKKNKKKKKKKAASSTFAQFGSENLESEGVLSANAEELATKLEALQKMCSEAQPLDSSQKQSLYASGKVVTTIRAPNHDAFLAELLLRTHLVDQGLDPNNLEMIAGCTGHPDCQCAFCNLRRSFTDLDPGDDSDSPSDSEESAGCGPAKEGETGPVKSSDGFWQEEVGKDCFIEVTRKRALFGPNAKVSVKTEVVRLPADGKDLLAHFQVQTRLDLERESFEKAITVVDVTPAEDADAPTPTKNGIDCKFTLGKRTIPRLTPEYLSQTAPGLPVVFCAEGNDFCVVEVEYGRGIEQAALGNERPLHFVLKFSGTDCLAILKEIMVEILQYVALRLKRPVDGWVLGEEDVFALLQAHGADNCRLKGMTLAITTGGRAVDVMTLEEIGVDRATKAMVTRQENVAAGLAIDSVSAGMEGFKKGVADRASSAAAPANQPNKEETADVTTTGEGGEKEGQPQQCQVLFDIDEGSNPSPWEPMPIPLKPCPKIRTYSNCSNCYVKERVLRHFKMCSRCKEQKVPNGRYYCSKECLEAHWKNQHRQEHEWGKW